MWDDHKVHSSIAREQYVLNFPINTSSIEHLVLKAVDMSIAGLLTVVMACRRLKTLSFTPERKALHDPLSSTGLAQVILHHAASLEELSLSFRYSMSHVLRHGGESDGPMILEESFQHLPRLHTLSTAITFGYGDDKPLRAIVNLLPPSLRHLHLERGPWRHDDALGGPADAVFGLTVAKLLQERGSCDRYPNLESISLSQEV